MPNFTLKCNLMCLTPSCLRYWYKYFVCMLPNLKKKLRKMTIVVCPVVTLEFSNSGHRVWLSCKGGSFYLTVVTFISKTLLLVFLCDYLCWISVTYFKLSANMGRKLIGGKALTKAEKQMILPKIIWC